MVPGKKSPGDNSEQEGNSKLPANDIQAKSNPQGQSLSTEAKEISKEESSTNSAKNPLNGNTVPSNLKAEAPKQPTQTLLTDNTVENPNLKRVTSKQGEQSESANQPLNSNSVITSNQQEGAPKQSGIAKIPLNNNATSNVKEGTPNSSESAKIPLTNNAVNTSNVKEGAPKQGTSSSDSGQKADVVKELKPSQKGSGGTQKAKLINK